MTFRSSALRSAIAASLSIVSLAACALDPAMLGAIAPKGQPGAPQPAQPGADGQPGVAGRPAQPGQPGRPGQPLPPGQQPPQGMLQPPSGQPQGVPDGGFRMSEQDPEGAALIEMVRALDADMEDVEAAEAEQPAAYMLMQAPPRQDGMQPPPPDGVQRPSQGGMRPQPQGAMPRPGQGGAQPQAGPQGPGPRAAARLDRAALRGAFGRARRHEERTADGGKQLRVELELDAQANGGGKRQIKLERKLDAAGRLVEQRQQMRGEDPDGRRVEVQRQKLVDADGSLRVVFDGKLTEPMLGEAEVRWEKRVGPDGRAVGKGLLRLLAKGKELPFEIDAFAAPPPAGRPSGIPSIRPTAMPFPFPTASAVPAAACDEETERYGMSGKAPTSAILNIQVTNDTHVMAGGAIVEVEVTGTGTHLGTGAGCTWVALFTEQRTSDPATGGTRIADAIPQPPVWAGDGLHATVKIDPKDLAANTGYWLRFTTKLADGSWEVAEGALLAH